MINIYFIQTNQKRSISSNSAPSQFTGATAASKFHSKMIEVEHSFSYFYLHNFNLNLMSHQVKFVNEFRKKYTYQQDLFFFDNFTSFRFHSSPNLLPSICLLNWDGTQLRSNSSTFCSFFSTNFPDKEIRKSTTDSWNAATVYLTNFPTKKLWWKN